MRSGGSGRFAGDAEPAAGRKPGEDIEGGGLLWTVNALDPPTFLLARSVLTNWRDAARGPGATTIKTNRIRTVVRLDPAAFTGATGTAGPVWILKQYRHRGAIDRLRYRLVPSRAVCEWRALRKLRALGIPVPRAIAVGERREGGIPVEGGLVIEEVGGSIPLIERLRRILGEGGAASPGIPFEAGDLIARSGALVRRLHDRGVDHRDLHASNFLVPDGGAGEIHVIDLHSVRFRKKLSRRRRAARLARLAHSLAGTAPPGSIRILAASYLGSPSPDPFATRKACVRIGARPGSGDGDPQELDRLVRTLTRLVEKVERRRLRSRSRRCVLDSTRFAIDRSRGATVFRRRELPASDLELLLSGRGEELKADGRGWVRLVPAAGRECVVKHRRSSLGEALWSLAGGHRLRLAYRAGFALEVRNVATPRVLALREERTAGLVRRSWLVTEAVPGARSLDAHLANEHLGKPPALGRAARRKFALARAVGLLIRAVHDAGVRLHDLSPQNILVRPDSLDAIAAKAASSAPPAVLLADLDGARLSKRLRPSRRARNLVQAGNLPEGHVTWSDRLRALRAYGAGEGFRRPRRRKRGHGRLAPGEDVLLHRNWVLRLREGLLREAARTLDRLIGLAGSDPR